MQRRQFCATLGTGGCLVASAGCLGLFGSSGLRLGGIVFLNRRDSTVVTRLRVDRDGTTVFDETYSFAAASRSSDTGVVVTDAWENQVGVYEVTVDVFPDMRESHEYTDTPSDGDCPIAYVDIREETVSFGVPKPSEDVPCEPTPTGRER